MNEPALAHQKEFSLPPDAIVYVPQATTLLGVFSDYIKGWSLGCNSDGGITVTLSRRDDNIVRVVNIARQDKKKFSVSSIKYRREDKWANAAKAVFYELQKAGIKTCGFNILLSGRGCSLSSYSLSAQIYAGLLTALNKLLSLGWDRKKMLEVALAASRFSLHNAARYRDLWLLFFGEEGRIYLFDEKTREVKSAPYSVSRERTYFFDSDIPYSVLTPEYDEFRANLPDLVSRFSLKIPRDCEIRRLTDKEIRSLASQIPDHERRYLLFLSASSECARNAFDAVLRGDGKALGLILSSVQRSLIVNAELTCPELDWIFRRAKESPAVIGMASIDAGDAGSFICVVDENGEFPNTQRVDEYERIFGFHPKRRLFCPYSSTRIIGIE